MPSTARRVRSCSSRSVSACSGVGVGMDRTSSSRGSSSRRARRASRDLFLAIAPRYARTPPLRMFAALCQSARNTSATTSSASDAARRGRSILFTIVAT